jgi:hypothetical protein
MPFQPGNKLNPNGRPKKHWIRERERMREAQRSWAKLLEIRDGLVLERREIGVDDKGQPIVIEVTASIKDMLACCKRILDRAVGLPKQEIDFSGEVSHPDGREWLKELNQNPAAVDLTRQFAALLVSGPQSPEGPGFDMPMLIHSNETNGRGLLSIFQAPQPIRPAGEESRWSSDDL